jgi:hypothetical protein
MANDTIDYAGFVDNAMRGVVRDILRSVERTGIPGQHHFFISFRTDYPGAVMSDMLRAKYPQEITIVLQHQYWDLNVEQDRFKVALSFNNIPEKLVVPFAALTGFADPSTKFGLQFHSEHREAVAAAAPAIPPAPAFENIAVSEDDAAKESAEIITLDAFRKK